MAGGQKWCQASLRISSRSLSCADITRVLMSEPTRCFEKGSIIGRGPAKRDETLWILESGLPASTCLERHVISLLEFVRRHGAVFARLKPECDFDISCGFSSESGQGGVVLSSIILGEIAAVPMDLLLDLYPPRS